MNYDYWRHSARAGLLHFFGRDELAYGEYLTAHRHAPSAAIARNLGALAAGLGRPADAVGWFEEALRLDPDDADTWFNLGFTRDRQGVLAEAAAAFAEALRHKPEFDRAWFGLGSVEAQRGRHAEAAAAFEEVARRQPMHGEAWYHLGMAHHHADNRDRVREVAEKLRTFDPKRSNQLIRDSGRSDLTHLMVELPY